jgi:hypothetical protein
VLKAGNSKKVTLLPPGRYVLWKNMAAVKVVSLDLRETVLDVSGQEIMTADKVTLRERPPAVVNDTPGRDVTTASPPWK